MNDDFPTYMIGQRQVDERGEWVVIGTSTANGRVEVSRVRAGSIAHQVLAQRETRLLPVAEVVG